MPVACNNAYQLNALLSLSENIISSEDEASQDGSEGQHEGESSQSQDESIDEYEGEASVEDQFYSSWTDHVDELSQTQIRSLT